MTTQFAIRRELAPLSQDIIEQLPDGCLWVDPDNGCIVGCNRALREALSYALHELIGRPLRMLVAASREPGTEDDSWRILAEGGELQDVELTLASRSGASVPMRVSACGLRGHDGSLRWNLVVLRDAARRRQTEHNLIASERSLRALAYELTMAETRERERIANGLHDEIGQILAMMRYKLGEIEQSFGEPAGRLQLGEQFAELQALLRQASAATRSATFDLSSPLLRQLGFKTAIEGVAQQLTRAAGPRVAVVGELPALPVAEPVLSVVFRVVRELLFNVQKHARASQATVSLSGLPDRLVVSVADNGEGFAVRSFAEQFGPEGGYGLVSAEAQMRAVGGSLAVESARGQGTRATVTLPLQAQG